MKLRNTLGLVIAAMTLAGCTATIQDIDATPVHESFVVNEKLEDLYYRLTTTDTKMFACNNISKSVIYPDRGEFRIYYGVDAGGLAGPAPMTYNAVYAKKQSETATHIDLKKTKVMMRHEKVTEMVANFVKTGRCE